jgi:hypothetical protein
MHINTTQVRMMMIVANRARCHQTRHRRGGVCTLLVDALLLLLMIVESCKGARIEDNADYQACLSTPASCTSLSASSSSLTGTIPTQLGTLTALSHL